MPLARGLFLDDFQVVLPQVVREQARVLVGAAAGGDGDDDPGVAGRGRRRMRRRKPSSRSPMYFRNRMSNVSLIGRRPPCQFSLSGAALGDVHSMKAGLQPRCGPSATARHTASRRGDHQNRGNERPAGREPVLGCGRAGAVLDRRPGGRPLALVPGRRNARAACAPRARRFHRAVPQRCGRGGARGTPSRATTSNRASWKCWPPSRSTIPDVRFNDGKCDPSGNFIAGTMHMNRQAGERVVGGLFRLRPDCSVEQLADDIGFANGPCFSPDGRTLYVADSLERTIWAYDYDPRGRCATSGSSRGPSASMPVPTAPPSIHRVTSGRCSRALPGSRASRPMVRWSAWWTCRSATPRAYASAARASSRPTCTTISRSARLEGRLAHDGGLFLIEGLPAAGRPPHRFADR